MADTSSQRVIYVVLETFYVIAATKPDRDMSLAVLFVTYLRYETYVLSPSIRIVS